MHVVFNIAKYSILFLLAAAVTTFMFYYTGFVATVYFYFFLYFIFLFCLRFFLKKPNSVSYKNIKYSTFTLVALLILVEAGFYYGDKERQLTMEELLGLDFYGYSFQKNYGDYYINPDSNETILIKNDEFLHKRTSNEEGIRERQIPEKVEGEKRVLCIGDSFTEGVGTTIDSSWVAVVQEILNKTCPESKITLINAGIGGSDPFFQYKLLVNRLLVYKPDIVVIANNTSDIFDYIERGGFNRFLPNGEVVYRNKPINRPLYNHSFIYRRVVHGLIGFDNTFNYPKERKRMELAAIDSILSAYDAIEYLGAQYNFKTVISIIPGYNELKRTAYDFEKYDLLVDDRKYGFDMMNCMRQFYNNNEMEKGPLYYWPKDGHYNGKGYKIVGECMAQYLTEILPCNQ